MKLAHQFAVAAVTLAVSLGTVAVAFLPPGGAPAAGGHWDGGLASFDGLGGLDLGADPGQAALAALAPDAPSLEDAASLQHLGALHLAGPQDLTAANGVRGGTGSPGDPYVLRDFYAPSLSLADVGASVRIVHAYIGGTLSLDHAGSVSVEDSAVGALDAAATAVTATGDRFGQVALDGAGGSFDGDAFGGQGALEAAPVLQATRAADLAVTNSTLSGPASFAAGAGALQLTEDLFCDASGQGVTVQDPTADVLVADSTFQHAGLTLQDLADPAGVTVDSVAFDEPLAGVAVHVARGNATGLTLQDLHVRGGGAPAGSVGVLVEQWQGGRLAVSGGSLEHLATGVQARDLAANSPWSVTGVAFEDVGTPVGFDASVHTRPVLDTTAPAKA